MMATFAIENVCAALREDATDRPKFYASMGPNFEKIIGEALDAARREGDHSGCEAARLQAWKDGLADGRREGQIALREQFSAPTHEMVTAAYSAWYSAQNVNSRHYQWTEAFKAAIRALSPSDGTEG